MQAIDGSALPAAARLVRLRQEHRDLDSAIEALRESPASDQLQLARLDRACDVTDLVDNVLGAAIGCAVGVVLLPVLRPWRSGRLTRVEP